MDLTLTADQELVASTARSFLESRCPMSHVREMETDAAGYSAALWKEMAELGWTGLAFSEADGGAAGTFLDLCLIVEEMGRFQLPSPFVPTVVLCGFALASHGSEEQRASRLPAIASGDFLMGYARAAPGAGWTVTGSTVTARRNHEGYTLTGSAMFVPYANAAKEFLVIAQHEGDDAAQLSAFLVPSDADGLSLERLETVRAEQQHRLTFEGTPLAAEALLGGADAAGRAAEVIRSVDAYGAAATCVEMVGGAQQVLDMTVEYAKQREQFDTPVGAFQAVQHHCADMGVDVLSSRLLTYEAVWRLAEGLDAAEEVSMAKAWVSEAYRRVCARGHQVHGAIGFTREHDLHYYFRHAVASELAFGDGDHHWELVARQLGLRS